MTKSKTMRMSEASPAPAKLNAVHETDGEALGVPGVRLCVPEPQTHQQIMDACEEEIRALAYQKWEEAGCPSCDGFDFWLEAEQEVLAARTRSKTLKA